MGNLFNMARGLFGGNDASGDENVDDRPADSTNRPGATGIGFLDGIISGFQNIFQPILDGFNNIIRGWFHKNGLNAELGMKARIDASPVFDQIVSQLGLPATIQGIQGLNMSTAEYLRKTTDNAVKNLINGGEMPTDPAVCVRKALHLQQELETIIGGQLRNQFTTTFRAAHPNATPQELAAELGRHNFALAASQSAAAVTGIDLDILNTQGLSDDDKITSLEQCNTGVLGMMLGTQRQLIGQNPHIEAASVPAMTVNADLIGQAHTSINTPSAPAAPAPQLDTSGVAPQTTVAGGEDTPGPVAAPPPTPPAPRVPAAAPAPQPHRFG